MLGERATGVSTYARGLERALALIGGRAPLVVEGNRPGGLAEVARDRPWRERWWRWLVTRADRPVRLRRREQRLAAPDVFRRAQRHFREHGTLLRLRAPDLEPGVMHWTYPVPIVLEGWINIYTVHDAIPFTHPELTPIDPDRHRRLLNLVAQRAAAILTVSDAAAEAIVSAGGLDPALIVNAGQPILPPAPAAQIPGGLVADRYFLVCGAVEPRKNLSAIVAAWQACGTELPLVVAGPDGWRSAELQAVLQQAGIVRLPFLEQATLTALMAGARALLFPSLAEGFGLPILEAMALGTPVLTSAGGATAEVAGGAALLVDPRATDAIADAIARLDQDPALRKSLAIAGRGRACRFSLNSFAERLGALHKTLIVKESGRLYRIGAR